MDASLLKASPERIVPFNGKGAVLDQILEADKMLDALEGILLARATVQYTTSPIKKNPLTCSCLLKNSGSRNKS